tara:strand:- start:864 stop:1148 length:285 start_codon:yes stop_codon:yes gene_type:complete
MNSELLESYNSAMQDAYLKLDSQYSKLLELYNSISSLNMKLNIELNEKNQQITELQNKVRSLELEQKVQKMDEKDFVDNLILSNPDLFNEFTIR